MTRIEPDREWWTAADLAAADLPDMPATQQGIDSYAKSRGWRAQQGFARRRAGRGGGWEYHWRLLPARAQRELISRANRPSAVAARPATAEMWTWFDGLPQEVKDKALKRLHILQEVEALAPALTKFLAVSAAASTHGVSERTIWNWFAMIEGIDPADRLPHLAPRNRAQATKVAKAIASPKFYDWLKADYLRPEQPSFSKAWREAVRLCKAHGLAFLEVEQTARRWLNDEVPRVQQVLLREGVRGLMKCYPPQIRDRSSMTALEGVNADCHKMDVFVRWPGFDKPIRPQVVAFQDIYSGKILSWRVDVDPNKVAVMQAFQDVLRNYGIPRHCLFDNGMEFANKWLSGGAPARFRFKIREGGEPLGVLAMLNVTIHFATPAHGQAKPVERAFGDFARDIAKDARFAGAYVGHRPDAKPENYGDRAIELEDFLRVLGEGVIEHNARPGRQSHTARGRSLDETFAESYERSPIRPASDEQLRLCLMAQQVRKLHAGHGQMTLWKNGYWSEWMNEFAGQEIVARFNPENLHEGAYIYSLAGEFLGYAECREKSPFFDLASAQADAKRRSRYLKAQRQAARDTLPISVGGLAADLERLPKREEVRPEARVVKLDQLAQIEQRRKTGGLIQRPVPQPSGEDEAKVIAFAAAFDRAPEPAKSAPVEPDTDTALFWRALELEQRQAAGERLSVEDQDFLGWMHRRSDYRARRDLYDEFGAAAIG